MTSEPDEKVDGIYAGYFTGVAGVSLGIFLFTGGTVAGADIGDGIYDGEYSLTDDSRGIAVRLRFTLPIGSASVTGAAAQNEPIAYEINTTLPHPINPDEVLSIETPNGFVNAKFRKIRDL